MLGPLSRPVEVEKEKEKEDAKDMTPAKFKRGKRLGSRRKYSKRSDYEAMELKRNRSSLLDLIFQAKDVWRIPTMKQFHASIALIVFTGIVVSAVFHRLCGPFGFSQKLFALWVVSYVVQEAHQFQRAPVDAMGDPYTIVDWSLCGMYIAVIVLRIELISEGSYWGGVEKNINNAPDLIAFFDAQRREIGMTLLRPHPWTIYEEMPQVILDGVNPLGKCDWSIYLEILRTLLAISIVFITVRIFEILTFEKDFARIWFTLETIYNRDMSKIIFLPLLMMVGFGIAFSILSPNFHLEGSDGPLYILRDWDNYIDISAGSSLWQAMYGVFGTFDGVELASSPGAAFVTPIMLYGYLFFITMPIINILIAVFSESYEAMDEDAARAQWHLRNAQQMQLFLRLYYALPMPLNLIGLPIELMWYMCTEFLPSLWRRTLRRWRRKRNRALVKAQSQFNEVKERSRWCCAVSSADCLRWTDIGTTKPSYAFEIFNSDLASFLALASSKVGVARPPSPQPSGVTIHIPVDEWQNFGLRYPLTTGHVIAASGRYFAPKALSLSNRLRNAFWWLLCCCNCCFQRYGGSSLGRRSFTGRLAVRKVAGSSPPGARGRISPNPARPLSPVFVPEPDGPVDVIDHVDTPQPQVIGRDSTRSSSEEKVSGRKFKFDWHRLGSSRFKGSSNDLDANEPGSAAMQRSRDSQGSRDRPPSSDMLGTMLFTPRLARGSGAKNPEKEVDKRYWRMQDMLIDDLDLERYKRFWNENLRALLAEPYPESKEEAKRKLEQLEQTGIIDELETIYKKLMQAKKVEEAARDKYVEQEKEEDEQKAEKHEALQEKLRIVERSNKQAVREACLEARHETGEAIRESRAEADKHQKKVRAELEGIKRLLEERTAVGAKPQGFFGGGALSKEKEPPPTKAPWGGFQRPSFGRREEPPAREPAKPASSTAPATSDRSTGSSSASTPEKTLAPRATPAPPGGGRSVVVVPPAPPPRQAPPPKPATALPPRLAPAPSPAPAPVPAITTPTAVSANAHFCSSVKATDFCGSSPSPRELSSRGGCSGAAAQPTREEKQEGFHMQDLGIKRGIQEVFSNFGNKKGQGQGASTSSSQSTPTKIDFRPPWAKKQPATAEQPANAGVVARTPRSAPGAPHAPSSLGGSSEDEAEVSRPSITDGSGDASSSWI